MATSRLCVSVAVAALLFTLTVRTSEASSSSSTTVNHHQAQSDPTRKLQQNKQQQNRHSFFSTSTTTMKQMTPASMTILKEIRKRSNGVNENTQVADILRKILFEEGSEESWPNSGTGHFEKRKMSKEGGSSTTTIKDQFVKSAARPNWMRNLKLDDYPADVLRLQKLRSSADPSGKGQKRWLDLFGGSSVETRFPLPERRQFPEVDWRGFNEDVFHESFGDFNPMKRWRKSNE